MKYLPFVLCFILGFFIADMMNGSWQAHVSDYFLMVVGWVICIVLAIRLDEHDK